MDIGGDPGAPYDRRTIARRYDRRTIAPGTLEPMDIGRDPGGHLPGTLETRRKPQTLFNM